MTGTAAGELRRIGIVRVDDRLGNLLLLLPALDWLRAELPRAAIEMIVSSAFAPLLAGRQAYALCRLDCLQQAFDVPQRRQVTVQFLPDFPAVGQEFCHGLAFIQEDAPVILWLTQGECLQQYWYGSIPLPQCLPHQGL